MSNLLSVAKQIRREASKPLTQAEQEEFEAMQLDLATDGFCNCAQGSFGVTRWSYEDIISDNLDDKFVQGLADLHRSIDSEAGTLAAVSNLRGILKEVIEEDLKTKSRDKAKVLARFMMENYA